MKRFKINHFKTNENTKQKFTGRDEFESLERFAEIVDRPDAHTAVGRDGDEIVRMRRADERDAEHRMRVAERADERALHGRRSGSRVPQHDLAAVRAADQQRRLEVGKRNRRHRRRACEHKLWPTEQIRRRPYANDTVRFALCNDRLR